VKQLNAANIGVRYLAFPRAGIGSDSYKKAVSVWCSANPNKALTDAKGGKQIKAMTCDNPVEQHYEMGRQMGIGGTPALVLDDGTEVGGYVPAPDLIKMLN
jgi:thiol:disulfide interchange protein DsbC